MRYLIIILSLIISADTIFGQTNQLVRLFVPFLDKESQSNVIVKVSDIFGSGIPCSTQYINNLSNTNLFTPEEKGIIQEIFYKYKDYRNLTTNSGPPGTVLVGLSKTNYVIQGMRLGNWVSQFKYTNSEAREEIRFGNGSITTKYLTESGNGYVFGIGPSGTGTTTYFTQLGQGKPNGFHLEFVNAELCKYARFTNEMIIGKYLMWNNLTGNMILEAEFMEPYYLNTHTITVGNQ